VSTGASNEPRGYITANLREANTSKEEIKFAGGNWSQRDGSEEILLGL